MWQTPPTYSSEEWRRRCEQSQQQARERRNAPPPGLLPRRLNEWLAVLAVCVLIVVGLLLARNAQAAEYDLVAPAHLAPGVHLTAPAHRHHHHR